MTAPTGPSVSPQRLFHRAFMPAVASWGLGGLMDRAVSSMIGLWLGWLRERTEKRLERMDQPVVAKISKAAPRARGVRKKRVYAQEWQVPPQWTTPLTWPRPAGPGVRMRRPPGWLLQQMTYRAAPFKPMLEALLARPDMMRLFSQSKPAVREWTPLLRMLAVDTNLIRHPGQTPPPRRKRAPRPPMTRHEKWWRALARDPNPGYRRVLVHDGKPGLGFHSREELRPKGCGYRPAVDPPPGWKRTAW